MQTQSLLTPPARALQPELYSKLPNLLPKLRKYARRLCKNPADAEDLINTTIVRALQFHNQYQRDTNLSAWLYQIARSLFITEYRSRKRQRRALAELAHDPNFWANPLPLENHAELSPGLQRALDELAPQIKSAILLVDLASLSYKEAAQVLDVPIGTIMSRISRGRKRLAEDLAQPLSSDLLPTANAA